MMKIRVLGEQNQVIEFMCPGCKTTHQINSGWKWNGSLTSPTFSPSVLVRCGCHAPGHKQGDHCWCTYNQEHADAPAPFKCMTCHSFVRDGKIQFLPDCNHELAGQTVELPDMG